MTTETSNFEAPKTVVIVPIYRNLEITRNCLESLLASQLPENTQIALINDASPEPEVAQYCVDMARENDLQLIVNDSNLGFVRTANKGFAIDPDADVLLLNSDVVVAGDWLHRMQQCAYKDSTIGTVTPFSNNGTICSYPVFPADNALPEGWAVADMDRLFKLANEGCTLDLPTAVGFCMYIKRECLAQVGGFDEENFGHGYGEECDFCVRASALQWRNVIAADVFVFHEGAVSFASESLERKKAADKVMQTLHPGYDTAVEDFIQQDPLYTLRSAVDALRVAEQPAQMAIVLEEHHRYSGLLLQRSEELRKDLGTQREQRRLLDEAIGKAQQMLNQMKKELDATSTGLANAEEIVKTQFSEIQDQDQKLHKAVGELYDMRVLAEQLQQKIELMENSRSWRFTSWMRRNS